MRNIQLLALLLAVSLSFSSLLWQVDIRGEPTTQPILFHDSFVIGSSDGNIYALNPSTGGYAWKASTGKAVDIVEFGEKIIALTKNGTVNAIDKNGKVVWKIDLKQVNATITPTMFYGLGKNSKNVFATTNIGIYKISENSASLFYVMNNTYGRPAVDEKYVVITVDENITKIDTTGKLLWNKQVNAKLWGTNPEVDNDVIYFGALDNELHALRNDGSKIFDFNTDGWIRTPLLIYGQDVYFGSDDTYVYKITNGGDLQWKAKFYLAPSSKPALGILGDKKAVFVGSSDGRVYAINDESGEVVWKTSQSGGIAGQPVFYQNKIIFASQDKYVYIYSTNRGCSIDSPTNSEVVGHKEVIVRGKSISTTGQQQVFISINGGGWVGTSVDANGDWVYYLDPQKELQEGLNVINCRVEDVAGSEEGSYTSVAFVRDSNTPLDNFIISIPNKPYENEPFEIYVNSKADGSPLERFTAIIDGQKYTGDKKITQTLAAGSHTVTIKKMGYNDKTITINVESRQINPLYIVGGGVLLLIVVWFVYAKFIKK